MSISTQKISIEKLESSLIILQKDCQNLRSLAEKLEERINLVKFYTRRVLGKELDATTVIDTGAMESQEYQEEL